MTDTPQTEPLDVRVTEAAKPLDVNVVAGKKGLPARRRTSESRSPNTTAEQDRRSKDQRRVNLIWEGSQALIALTVVFTTAIAIFIGRTLQNNVQPFPAEWWTIVGLVIGFYFGRTNHSRIGDDSVSSKDTSQLDDRA